MSLICYFNKIIIFKKDVFQRFCFADAVEIEQEDNTE